MGGLSLLWNAFGAYDYVMKNVRNSAYLGALPTETTVYLNSLPGWAVAAWAVGVWGAVLGSILLLLRSRFAIYAFAASLAGLAVNTVYDLDSVLSSGQPAGLTVAIWAGAVVLLLYAVRMRLHKMLR